MEKLSSLQKKIIYENGTEPPFQNEYWDHFEPGLYVDVTTGEPLFTSLDKFHSSCGWPSFSKPITKDAVKEVVDTSHFMVRTEIRTTNSDIHLGHVFEDGPLKLGGLRYCMNSAALKFIPLKELEKSGYKAYMHLFEK